MRTYTIDSIHNDMWLWFGTIHDMWLLFGLHSIQLQLNVGAQKEVIGRAQWAELEKEEEEEEMIEESLSEQDGDSSEELESD